MQKTVQITILVAAILGGVFLGTLFPKSQPIQIKNDPAIVLSESKQAELKHQLDSVGHLLDSIKVDADLYRRHYETLTAKSIQTIKTIQKDEINQKDSIDTYSVTRKLELLRTSLLAKPN